MKRLPPKTFTWGSIRLWWIPLLFAAATSLAVAASLQEARVSQVIQDVRLLEAHAAPRPAAVNDKVTLQRAVRTGKESRAELTFTDLTITRLGANTIFSLKAGAREVDLTSGTILLAVPSGAPPAKANTVSVTVAVMGGTALLATGPPTKFMVLEGTGTIYPKGHPEKAVTVQGGEMVLATEDGRITQPEKFDVKLVLETSPLFLDFPPLANLPLILAVMNQQLAEQQLAGITSQSLVRNLVDVIDVTDQNANANPILVAVRSTTPAPPPPTPTPTPSTPTPTPSKFGTPSTITAPNPYVITSGTVITTDPSITTSGVTDYGKIYRGSTDDGAFTQWAFGSTSAFDSALNIDTDFFADPNHLPIATFKFQSLSLTGNPTIDLSNGGVTKLALIGVDGITSGPPGGLLTFTGLDLLVLATVNGSINLTSDVSFQDFSELAMYARGAGSDLTIDSPISNIGILEIAAEGSIQLTNPGTMSVGAFDATAGNNLTLQIGSLLLDGKARLKTLVLPGTTVATGANLTLNVTGDYTNSSATEFSLLQITNQGAHIGTGGNIAVNIGGNFTATGLGSATEFPEPGDFQAIVQNTNGLIDNGGNLNLTVNGNVQVNGLAAYLQNYDETANPAGHIGTGGNIDIEIGGNLTANSYVDVFLNNRGGGMIDSGGNLTFNVSGALTIGADAGGTELPGFSAEFIISNRYDDIMGNTTPSFIGSDVSLFLHAASIDMAGILFGSGISNRLGSVIDGNATVTWDVPGNVMIQGTTPIPNSLSGASWFILNDVPPDYQFTPPSGGTIHGSATLTLNIGGDLTIAGDASTEILNQRDLGSTVPSGGTIDSDATLNITAANFSVGGELDVDIRNRNNGIGSGTGGGSIGGNAAINLNLSGNLTTTASDPNSGGIPGNAYFYIANESDVGGSGGFIGGDATIDLNIVNASIAGIFDVEIDNFSGGTIGGNATISVGASSDISIVGDTFFNILNESGTIGSAAMIDVAANNISVGGSLNTFLVNQQGSIGGNAAINFLAPGGIDAGNGAFFAIVNDDTDGTTLGGTIAGDALVQITADHLSTEALVTSDFNLFGTIHNSGGSIVGNCDVMFDISGAITTQGRASFDILNFDDGGPNGGGTIGGDATVNINASAFSIGGELLEKIINNAGAIGGNALINAEVSGAISTESDAVFQILNQGGTIKSDATINVTAASISTGSFLFSDIENPFGGTIGGNANLNFSLTGDLNTQGVGTDGVAIFEIFDFGDGTISSDATINVSAANISTGDMLFGDIDNRTVGGNAIINFSLTGDLNTLTDAKFQIADGTAGGTIGLDATINISAVNISSGGELFSGIFNTSGTIGGDATINVNAANITANSLVAQIDNTGGSIGTSTEGGATINMNVSGSATVTNDATVAIYGSDGAIGGAAINFTNGSYDAGGTFLAFIDGSGTITFDNATAHADVLKVGALGTNGVLNIGGGMLSADTTLELYASGSNGQLNFVSNVTLGGNSVKILAANSITIFDNIVVTIGGSNPAEVYTNNANYSGFGGNGTTTGTFDGAGANNPLPLDQAPPFGPAPRAVRSRDIIHSSRTTGGTINVNSTAELLALLDGAAVGPDGRITVSDPRIARNGRDISRMDANGLLRAEHRMAIQQMRDRSVTRVGGGRLAAAQ